jgi:hypothetical protein
MRRLLLPLLTAGLLIALVADRAGRFFVSGPGAPPVQGATETRSATTGPTADAPAPAAPRRAAHEQLTRELGRTYLDSLIIGTDSMVRRWADRGGSPLRVCIVEGGAPGYAPHMAGLVREALDRWEQAGISGLRFAVVGDTASADIQVHWIEQFGFDRAGQTDLTWDQTAAPRSRSRCARTPASSCPTRRSCRSRCTRWGTRSGSPTRPTRTT